MGERLKQHGRKQHQGYLPLREDLPEDEDEKIDSAIKEVWNYYDKKQVGFLNKKQGLQFFKDALELMALRRGVKTKDLLAPGVALNSALNQCFEKMDKTNSQRIDYAAFEEFINENDIDEALQFVTGNTGPVTISTSSVQMADNSSLPTNSKTEVSLANIEYRDYPSDDE